MQQRALHRLFLRRPRYIHALHRKRIYARVVHARRDRAGRGIEILHLPWIQLVLVEIFREYHRVLESAARMARHQIRYYVLIESHIGAELVKPVRKPVIYLSAGLVHIFQHVVRNVLRRYSELTADMIFQKLAEKRFVAVCNKIVKPYPRAHKHLFHALYPSELSQKLQIFRVIHLHVRAQFRVQALPVRTRAGFELFFAGGIAEIRRRSAHVMDISLEIWIMRHQLRLAHHTLVAP